MINWFIQINTDIVWNLNSKVKSRMYDFLQTLVYRDCTNEDVSVKMLDPEQYHLKSRVVHKI